MKNLMISIYGNEMKAIATFLMAILLLVSCGGNPIVEPKGGDAHMVLMEREFDCGQVTDEDGIVEHEFVVANDGGKPFVVLSARPHCDCTTVDFEPVMVKPGYGTAIKVRLDVTGISSGEFLREVDITPSCQRDPANMTITLKGVKL